MNNEFSTVYYNVNVFDRGNLVLSVDYDTRLEAVTESVAFSRDGFETEIIPLSTAGLFDTAPDTVSEVDRVAY